MTKICNGGRVFNHLFIYFIYNEPDISALNSTVHFTSLIINNFKTQIEIMKINKVTVGQSYRGRFMQEA